MCWATIWNCLPGSVVQKLGSEVTHAMNRIVLTLTPDEHVHPEHLRQGQERKHYNQAGQHRAPERPAVSGRAHVSPVQRARGQLASDSDRGVQAEHSRQLS